MPCVTISVKEPEELEAEYRPSLPLLMLIPAILAGMYIFSKKGGGEE